MIRLVKNVLLWVFTMLVVPPGEDHHDEEKDGSDEGCNRPLFIKFSNFLLKSPVIHSFYKSFA
jgi:hypothetical protein